VLCFRTWEGWVLLVPRFIEIWRDGFKLHIGLIFGDVGLFLNVHIGNGAPLQSVLVVIVI